MNIHAQPNITSRDIAILAAMEDGLPLTARPFEKIARRLAMSQDEVIARLAAMQASGVIRRFGLVLHHHSLGYRANAMTVWDVPDAGTDAAAAIILQHDFVTLCYKRARAPRWPYNLYCMIHGHDRKVVESQIDRINRAGLGRYPHQVLFSTRRFKQTGARFASPLETERRVT